MEVAQLDSNKKVVNTFLIKKTKMIDVNTGSVTQESCQAFCEGKFGDADSKFIPIAPGRINPPDVGDTYDEAKDIFYEDQPKSGKDGTLFSSWTLDDNGIWQPPHAHDENTDYMNFQWKEQESCWKAKKSSELAAGNWFKWNTGTSAWDDTGSTDW